MKALSVQALTEQLPCYSPRVQCDPVRSLSSGIFQMTEGRQIWIPSLTLPACVTLAKSLNQVEPQFPHPQNGADLRSCLIGLLQGSNELTFVKHFN